MKCLAKTCFLFSVVFFCASCTIYTEKRSEALSQAVFATSDSITYARFDLASQYSKQAERLAFPPKQRIKVSPIYTARTVENNTLVKVNDQLTGNINSPTVVVSQLPSDSKETETPTLRLVVPEHLKHAKLLIENSNEWTELLKTKQFSIKLQEDYTNLQRLTDTVSHELQKQTEMNNKLVADLNTLQKRVLEKDLAILKRNIAIIVLCLVIGGGTYLRIKGIL
jgi:hypothetical protein